jgi:hypothetical protein
MTIVWNLQSKFMYLLQKLIWAGCLYLIVSGSSTTLALNLPAADNIRAGFNLAQACENEIDDDMAMYEECIGHVIDRAAGKKHSLLGAHFQAWLMADLAARQNSPRALALRQRHYWATKRQLRATGLVLDDLCSIKKLSCATVRARMSSNLGP